MTVIVPVHGAPSSWRAAWHRSPAADARSSSTTDRPTPARSQLSPIGSAPATFATPRTGAPSAARNTGLELAETPFVAFLDSDCIPSPGFPGALLDHLADPAVALVAPRIVSVGRAAGPDRRVRAASLGARHGSAARRSCVPTAGCGTCRARRWWRGARRSAAGFDEELDARRGRRSRLAPARRRMAGPLRPADLRRPRGSDRADRLVSPAGRVQRIGRAAARRHPERLPALFVLAAVGARLGRCARRRVARAGGADRRCAQRGCTARSPGGCPARRAWAARASARGDGPGGTRARAARSRARGRRSRSRPLPRGAARPPGTTRRAARRRARGRLARGSPGARPAQLRRAASRGRVRPRRRHLARVHPRP